MNEHGLTRKNMVEALPLALKSDASVVALAEAMADLLSQRPKEIDELAIYPRIDELPEELLDILAYDFKVDWWDYDYSLEEKRRTLKVSWMVHKRLGTKWAVRTAISAIYPESTVERWFEYGGKPYYFRFLINSGARIATLEQQIRVLRLAQFYQSLRDRLDEIIYVVEPKEPSILRLGGCVSTIVCLAVPEMPDDFQFEDTVHMGGAAAVVPNIPVPETPDTFRFTADVRLGGGGGLAPVIPVPQAPDDLRMEDTVRLGGTASLILEHPVPEEPDRITFEGAVHMGGGFSRNTSFPVPRQEDQLKAKAEVRVGGKYAVISATPLAEHKEE